MYSLRDLFLVIIGTNIITALLMVVFIRGRTQYQEPQVVYVQTVPEDKEPSNGCLPQVILILNTVLLILLFLFK